ncbi:hypothetical protein FRC03_006603 [Tulasnella sp. 419]|nr:hypothetical protein FRC02_004858 [Tulasnella sp. 418]KAG8960364.1 hypothetical protein FRC03_006603 [Tulasnella sp. 419]
MVPKIFIPLSWDKAAKGMEMVLQVGYLANQSHWKKSLRRLPCLIFSMSLLSWYQRNILTLNGLHRKGLEFIEEEPYDCTCHNCFDLDHDGLDDYGTLGGQQSSTDNAKTTPLDMSSTTSTNCYLPYITPPVVHHSSYNAHAYGSMQPISDMMFLLPKEL